MTLRGALTAFLEVTLRVRPGEGRRTALLFAYLMFASAVFFLGRTVRDTLFLSRYSIAALPWMFVAYGVASAVTVLLYAQVADRLTRRRLVELTGAVGILTFVATWFVVRTGAGWIYPVFYVWTEIVANLFIVQFWTIANDMHDARSAKRLFGTIGSARLAASVLVGLGTGAVVHLLGTEQLILVLAGNMVVIVLIAAWVTGEARPERANQAGAIPRRHGPPPRILGDPYVISLGAVLLLAFTAVNVGDYQFKVIARATYREDDLATFFALFYGVTGVIAFLFQLFATPRILARRGVGWGMGVMPWAFGGTTALLLAWPRLAVATVMKFADNGFQYTIQENTFQALYVPFAPEVKARARALLDAAIKPAGYAVAGLAVIALAPMLAEHPERFGFLSLPLVVAWIAMIPLVKRRYVRQLETTLSARGAFALDSEFVLDTAGRKVLLGALRTGPPRQVLVAMEQLSGERTEDVSRAVESLVGHGDARVRSAALYHLAASGTGRASAVFKALDDTEPDVRAAAAAAYASTARDEGVEALADLLEDSAPDVRVAALVGLLRDVGIEGSIVGGAELGRLLASGLAEDRVAAARTLRHLGEGAYRPLRRLLEDADPEVRRAALKAASGVADKRLVPALVRALADPSCRRRAGAALVAVGEAAAPALAALLDDATTPRSVRMEVPRLLRRIPRPSTYALLRDHIHERDGHLRQRILAAMSRMRQDLGRPPEKIDTIRALVEAEIAEEGERRMGWRAARLRFDAPLLEEIFRVRSARAVRRVLRTLELRCDPEPLRLVRAHLGDPARRPNALEVLDTLLDAPLRPLVMPFVDQDLARQGDGDGDAGEVDPVAFMREHCRHPNAYIALLALDALARAGESGGAAEAERLLTHPDPLVREGAIAALSAGDPGKAPGLLREVARDRDRVVARHASNAIARLEGRQLPEETMYSTVEKILLLKSAPAFERVIGEDLAALARVAEVECFAPGETIMEEGDVGDALFVIVRGRVEISRGGQRIATLGTGEPMGEMSMFDDEPRSATATALEDVEVLRIGSEEFYEVLYEQVELAMGVIRTLIGRLREADARLAGRVG